MYEENTERGGYILSYLIFKIKKKFLIVLSKKVIETKYVNLLQFRRYTLNSPRNVTQKTNQMAHYIELL